MAPGDVPNMQQAIDSADIDKCSIRGQAADLP